MAAIGGSLDSIGIAGREFAVAADAEAQRKLGGFENEVMSNGNGTARIIKTRVPLALNGVTVEIDDDRGDQEFLQDIADGNDFVPVVLNYSDNRSYGGQAILTGEFLSSSQSVTAPINLMGPGRLNRL